MQSSRPAGPFARIRPTLATTGNCATTLAIFQRWSQLGVPAAARLRARRRVGSARPDRAAPKR